MVCCAGYRYHTYTGWQLARDLGWHALKILQTLEKRIQISELHNLGERPTILDSHSDKVFKRILLTKVRRKDVQKSSDISVYNTINREEDRGIWTNDQCTNDDFKFLYPLPCSWCCTPKYRKFFVHLFVSLWSVKSFFELHNVGKLTFQRTKMLLKRILHNFEFLPTCYSDTPILGNFEFSPTLR